VVVGPEHPAFFQIEVGQGMEQFETFQKSAAVLLGLTPERVQAVTGDAFDLYGRRRDVVGQFLTLAPRAHLAINEVYADANGPEPQQEWLELVNSGTVAENLAGYVLEDVGGETELPAVIVEAGAYAVIVNADYVPDPELDIVAEPSALLLRVERLGKSGLSNSGELLRLQSPTGEVVSRFPMRPQPKPGISVARRAPWSMDGDSSAFGLHRAPGASPGSPNQLQSELD
jgi:hypothetical protein